MIAADHVIFDLDGTLTDPKLGITRCIIYALEKMGRTAPAPEELTWCIGPPLADFFPRLLGTKDSEEVRRAVTLYRERFADVGMFENEVYPDVPLVLQELIERKKTLYVATSKPLVYAEQILHHFGLAPYFTRIYGSSLSGALSKKADLLDHLVACEGFPPGQGVMVGDREHDIFGAKSAGLSSIGVLYGYGTRQELSSAQATEICRKPRDILGVIE